MSKNNALSPEQQLQKTFKFSSGDISANRAGRVSKRQIRRQFETTLLYFVPLAVMYALMYGMWSKRSNFSVYDSATKGHYVIFFGILIFFVIFTGVVFVYQFAIWYRMKQGIVLSETGKIRRKKLRDGAYGSISDTTLDGELWVGDNGTKLKVDWRPYNALVRGQSYRVYYLPATFLTNAKILSLEPVPETTPPHMLKQKAESASGQSRSLYQQDTSNRRRLTDGTKTR